MTTTVTTTIIEDETTVITVRMGASMVLTARQGDEGENVYTLPGQEEKTDTIDPLGPYTYGPYDAEQTFSITATGIVQADVIFTDADSGSVVFNYVAALPSTGRQGVIYCTEDAAYWWSGAEFVPMGSGSTGQFTALTASGLLRLTGVEATITANAGGGKADATALSATANFHRISVCATAADSVLLPAASVGQIHFVRNDGAAAAQIFGAGTDTINGIATGTGASIGVGQGAFFLCVAAGAWISTLLTAGLTVSGGAVVNTNFPFVVGTPGLSFINNENAKYTFSADGDLVLTPAAGRDVQFGTAVASVATPSTDMIQIKAADGTTYGLLAVLIP